MANALVIDDSKVIRIVLSRMLTEVGLEPATAGDGQEALEVLEREGPAIGLALVDWNMPKLNGLGFVEAVRARREYDGMRIVMVTTETEISQMVRALEAGANEYIMKPFTNEAVVDKLRLLGVVN